MGAMKEWWMTQVIEGRAQGQCTCELFDDIYDPECTQCNNAEVKEARKEWNDLWAEVVKHW